MLVDLKTLRRTRAPGLTDAIGASYAEAASVCLHLEGHGSEARFLVSGTFQHPLRVVRLEVSRRMLRAWADENVATEQGAYGCSIAAMHRLTGLTVIERARRRTGFDFWLGRAGGRSHLLRHTARLEVSGIRRGDDAAVQARLRIKKHQTRQSDATRRPAWVAVVEFGRPQLFLVRR